MREVKNVYSLNIDKFSAAQSDIEEKQKGKPIIVIKIHLLFNSLPHEMGSHQ
jgi:carboxyl-terminal processing protease